MKPMPENATVGILSELLALECGYTPAEALQIRIAAVLHDTGKQLIPDHIKNKPGKLSPQEFEIMKTHVLRGYEMLLCLRGGLGDKAKIIALTHHEYWNGQGYLGIPASILPQYVCIVSLCDVLVSLLYRRVYKPAWPPEEALAYIKSMAGIQFCPELTDKFISLIRCDTRIPAIFMEVLK